MVWKYKSNKHFPPKLAFAHGVSLQKSTLTNATCNVSTNDVQNSEGYWIKKMFMSTKVSQDGLGVRLGVRKVESKLCIVLWMVGSRMRSG